MGYPNEIFVQEIGESFRCTICRQVLQDPVLCGSCQQQLSCNECLQSVKTSQKPCPSCQKQNFNVKKVIRTFSQLLLSLVVRCRQGCGQEITLEKLEEHEQSICSQKWSKCEACEKVISKDKIQQHDCLQELMTDNISLNDEYNIWKGDYEKKIQSQQEEIQSIQKLSDEIEEDYKQRIQQIQKDLKQQVNSKKKLQKQIQNLKKPKVQSDQVKSDKKQVQNEGEFPIIIANRDGGQFELFVSTDTTIKQLKQKINDAEGFAIEKLCIVFEGKPLEDHLTIEECGIQENSKVHLVFKIRN